ncbi:MAG: HlyD family efflux transporter periplasmic adaptor subunit [Planctomycetota bacterium]|nr:MAG: HlyD family efflux transporter periplasmic adaptor subunit [Planctomycetota bacterium]REK18127.1 MAG: HlyD family efflux transporter periplasmic adaptor subunit [Planctomycetota bacterium]REK44204.1 MAG: HlyD family efflux transporter periplasmic adaptor subunit [Planctomycetota bacterium]
MPAVHDESARPIPLIARRDVAAEAVDYQGETYWVVKDPLSLAYFRLRPEQYGILQLLDGRRSLREIGTALTRRFPTCRPTSARLFELIADLHKKGLAWSNRPGQGEALDRRRRDEARQRWRRVFGSLLFIRLPGWDPQPLIDRLYPAVRWAFHPLALALATVTILSAWLLLLTHFAEFQRRLPDVGAWFGWESLLLFWLTLGFCKMLHELGHALALRHFEGESHEIGIAFLVFSPCLYCDVSDAWMLPSKWRRMAIGAAGMAVELTLSAVALLLWWQTHEGWLSHVLLNVFLVTNISSILFNLNPLLRLDGYYLFGDWLEIPNLRDKSNRLFWQTVARGCLAVRPQADPTLPRRRRGWFIAYAIASAGYRWLLVFMICLILYQTLRPYHLQHVGLLLGIVSAAVAISGGGRRLTQLFRAHRGEMSGWRRPALCGLSALLLLGAALVIPFPLHVDAPLVVEPRDARRVYNGTPGLLAEVGVRPGDRVRRGQVLLRLTNGERQEHYEKLRTALEIQRVELRVQQLLGDAAQEAVAAQSLQAITTEVEDYRRQLARLTIVAPCDGTVIAAPPVAEPRDTSRSTTLPGWHGTPLDRSNTGCFLPAGTHLLSIAPQAGYQAVALIRQSDRHDFDVQSEVRMKLDHLPGQTFHGSIAEIATAHAHPAAGPAENRLDAGLRSLVAAEPLPADRGGFQATVFLEGRGGEFLPGMTGRMRIVVVRRTAADWLWRYLRMTFNFYL